MRFFVLFLAINSWLLALNFSVVHKKVAHGATTLMEFEKEQGINYKQVQFGKRVFPVYDNPLDDTKKYVLIPVNYYDKPSTKELILHYEKNGKNKQKKLHLTIKDGEYKKEKITVQKNKVNPPKSELKRINKEYHEAMGIYGTSTKKNYLKSEFIFPLNSFITSDFGKARVYNDALKGYHSGTDFRAKLGTPIKASNDGKVVLVKERFYSGGTVLIDHGHGIYTCYYHMSEFSVKKDQQVKKGDIIGLSGQSGRVTGPHLHFSVRVNGVQVDPLQFVQLMNDNLLLPSKKG